MLEDGLKKVEDMLYEKASFAVEVSAIRIKAFFVFELGINMIKVLVIHSKYFAVSDWVKSPGLFQIWKMRSTHQRLYGIAHESASSLGKHTIDQPQVN